MKILHKDQLPLGGFAGLKETRMVTDSRVWGNHKQAGSWDGLGNFVYLADAQFMPKGETGLHPHHEIDVISVMLDGRIAHEGSLEHGELLQNYDVQVQRAGGEGFQHNEVNPDNSWNRMIQLWILPEVMGQPASYKKYEIEPAQLTQVYGGKPSDDNLFPARTIMQVGLLGQGQTVSLKGEYMAYLCHGAGRANAQVVGEGALIRGMDLDFIADQASHLISIHEDS